MISDFEDYGAGELFDVKVEGGKLTGRSKIRIYYNSSDYDEAYVVGFDQAKDLALLKLDAPTVERKPVVLCSPDDSMVGSTVYAVGYPGLSENIFAGSTTYWGGVRCQCHKWNVQPYFYDRGNRMCKYTD